ncbi:hypothetical protein [Variovorax sp. PBL-E5]|uniref:hypothetical protein n=1 Tax=Variovorax sp. PBL-E5 TaxID=434014 RepID=UPI00131815AF|nr:hypothetical protein [Variovorax sp. PBL-E5]VTU37141.1 hypothetical protein E5CHR_04496 [Variovorax sp. PBL-E5]
MVEKRKGAGGKLSRSETVTVRLDPKLRYLAELAARKQRRTLSSFIEWAIEDTLNRFPIREWDEGVTTVMSQSENLWDVDDSDRFAKLALAYPELLTHDEQLIWKLVKECGYLWRGGYSKSNKEWTWTVREESFLFDRLRAHWAAFQAVAAGEVEASALPKWPKTDPKVKSSSGFDDMDDDIPF